ncbi:acetyl-CoA carboxylase biotin carboxyl carrier protein [Roseomonas alkaliterrae]|jgi:acetyl-CoA carboxylase biotin carboxyl carrier protein|uniref:Biotin carboxyl carrier protein of acetyl-CoA carboxylase n=1 Tax=Neoroseomonas alkaliterrae TaxID=1452450 RepID=A0A840Y8A3_9PROT|nr:acetyl-CoA carboxylase biotin carboxyl carrier protein [Neoroseomonas alkaliterrae]MBB5690812.1 acetyl-CoA carboxylase biotin carboxyl carrier protein [Neoroseomonas alkaliterrae]MBR0675785.1 acetyl-CoA carboxylase biotin carboxyl carrier protein [Neoroseomonas alkaliterrae]
MGNFIEFDAAAIRELAQILRETDLTEIELVDGEARLRVVRQAIVAAPAPAATQVTVAAPAAAPVTVTTAQPAMGEAVDADHPGAVTSPMVGVAYLSPEPGAQPFVTVGAKVVQGQTLLLIEAMKTFNQIKAPRSGTVTRILVESGMPVEYGEPLMIIE